MVTDYKNNCTGLFNNIDNNVTYKNFNIVDIENPEVYFYNVKIKHPTLNKWYTVEVTFAEDTDENKSDS